MRAIANPFDPVRLGDFLLDGLRSDATGFSGASAFARRSGVAHLVDAIKSFSATRPFRLVVGIDLHSTSIEALELLLSSAGRKARIHVFHNPAAVFHPKFYRFEYADRWEAYCGSGNLTAGGLFDNYEIGFVVGLAKAGRGSAALTARLEAEFGRWRNVRSGNAKPLTRELIEALRQRRLILPEVRIREVRAAAEAAAGRAPRRKPLFPRIPVPRPPALPQPAAAAKPTRRRGRNLGGAMAGSRKRLSERAAWPLMLGIAAGMPGRRATTQELTDRIPNLYPLSAADRVSSNTRERQPRWHQIVRNVISHRETKGSPFQQGLAERTADGLEVTDEGIEWLREVGLIA